MDSLAWVDDPTRLVLGPGTLKYTGTGETVPGLTLNAGASKQAILDVENDLTLGSVLIGTSAFSKTGPGDLVLKGPGAFNLGNTNKGKSQMLGIGLYGDSPIDTFQYITVADGRLIIGEEGGTEAEPYIVLSGGEMDIGGCTASSENGRQETAGEFVMNSGTFICNYVQPGYYNGSNGTYPEGGTLAKVTVNGGYLKTGTYQGGYDNMQTHVLSMLVTMTGGVFEIGDGRRVRDRHAQLPVRARQPGLPALDDLEPVGRRHDLHGVQRRRHRHRRKHHQEQRRVGTGEDDAHELHVRGVRHDDAEERHGHGDR